MLGVDLYTFAGGLRYKDRDDLLLVMFPDLADVWGVFSKNRVLAHPVIWSKDVLKSGNKIGAIIFNAGQANAVTGKNGKAFNERVCTKLAKLLGLQPRQVLVSSTGVIGDQLPIEKYENALPLLLKGKLASLTLEDKVEETLLVAASAIMTTDTFPKAVHRQLMLADKKVNIWGIAKGSGMIAPNMATLLGLVVTDLFLDKEIMQKVLQDVVDNSFNIVSVDGDCSTNDTVFLASTGKVRIAGAFGFSSAEWNKFYQSLLDVFYELSLKIAKDGEGATKLIVTNVTGAKDNRDAGMAARSVGESLLVRSMIAGKDANWGRILMALGKSGAVFDLDRVTISMCGIKIFEQGEQSKTYSEKELHKKLENMSEITIEADLNSGSSGKSRFLSCDLTEDYVKINADYRS